ncbi:MFS transporter [Dermatophilus congolensis]|uniref:MFS transporter n=1 Tax=Dermatophilus congolensis TaxID=1863 RepID=UPI001AAF272B|nr:MFS transporter [Dermatophilus congolensis]MBO3129141.1 MFS transporter [Dermatophilus congolensis]MBO3132222.1 MFS transporter [Dermatophilus congolensis]MBO3133618.1 MFS transporter [Dermatophilus congolensis]MBO3135850.1 MFS transporter [Dermatophilus congolensis]MBO3138092.1 MFS transporter [Dermatophilus congolensis]
MNTQLQPHQRTTAATIITLISIVAFEAMAISTVMPNAANELNLHSGYGLTFSALYTAELFGIVIAGAWIATRGALAPLITGQLLFALGAATCGAATTATPFIIGRALTGLGSGLVTVTVYVLVGALYHPTQRPRLFAWISAAWVLPSIIGPLLAGLLAQTFTWRLAFWIVIPAVAIALPLLIRHHHTISPAGIDPHTTSRTRLALLTCGAAIAASAAALQASGTHLIPPTTLTISTIILSTLTLGAALHYTFPTGTLRLHHGIPSVISSRFFLTAAFNATMAYLPLYLVNRGNMTLTTAGIILACASIGWFLGSTTQGHPLMHGQQHRLVRIGALTCLCSYVLFTVLTYHPNLHTWWFIPTLALTGIGMGLSTASLSVLALHLTPLEQHASISSSLQLSDVLGATLGLTTANAIYATAAATQFGAPTTGPHTGNAAYGAGAYMLIWTMAIITAIGAAIAANRTTPTTPQ